MKKNFHQLAVNSTCTALVTCWDTMAIREGDVLADCLESLGMPGLDIVDADYFCSRLPVGNYPHPNSDNCLSYVMCYNGQMKVYGYINGYVNSCNFGLFNPATKSCDNTFVCNV